MAFTQTQCFPNTELPLLVVLYLESSLYRQSKKLTRGSPGQLKDLLDEAFPVPLGSSHLLIKFPTAF